MTLATTRFRRPVLESAVCNAKAGALYPNNARMLVEARAKGFSNALVADALGNVAEAATANVFMVPRRRGLYPDRQRHLPQRHHPRPAHRQHDEPTGMTVHETVLSFDDFRGADEVFFSAAT